MNDNGLQKQLLKDDYIDIAFKRYLKFKDSEQYDESYKKEILSKLNSFLNGQDISVHTVVDIVKKIQKENPTAGSFVHWSNTFDLVSYAEARPEEVARLLNELYHSDTSIEERIENVRKEGKLFNPSISLGAPLFGYLFAARDYTKYPIYKQEVFTDIKKSYGIEMKLGSVGNNYETYLSICERALKHLKNSYPDLTMLDVQDFFFCSTQYHEIKVESAVEYLHGLAKELSHFKDDTSAMLESISNLDSDILLSLREQYRNSEKVNLIKFKVLDKLMESGTVTVSELEEFKNEVKDKYDTNILHSWNNFTILFQLYYANKKLKVQEELRKIHEAIRQMDGFNELKMVEGKVLNGFNWNQSFGCSECWLAVYENSHPTHRTAPQLFVSIDESGIRYGLLYGDQHFKRGDANLTDEMHIEKFTYEDLHRKMVSVRDAFHESYIQEPEEPYQFDISIETWKELLEDRNVFYESDLEYIFKMFELGGGATATQLAEELGKHFSSFNAPVVQLAKRVLTATNNTPPKREDGSDTYWNVLFDGEYESSNRFKWILKENLKEAINDIYEDTVSVQLEPYTKDNFLQEVFMDETQYHTITNLLFYKKNIILQGPPGVGKTFVSKRLAYALMGVKDNDRVEMVQFHQNYAYEDFVMGYRPEEDRFVLQSGIFYDFCEKALKNPEKNYYFIIDEINRGNLSKIFGELFMLIEKDKRDEFVTMGYSKKKFTVPSNVFLIGTMNTADRSLAQIEVALRRRFAFVTLRPSFSDKWKFTLKSSGVSEGMIERILFTVDKINKTITEDFQLGPGYAIGHSFFTSKPENLDEDTWFRGIIDFEIYPLLEEYFFDRPEIVQSLIEEI